MKIKKNSDPEKRSEGTGGGKGKGRAMAGDRVDRTVYITVATLLMILAAAVALTSAANRARRGGGDTTAEGGTSASPAETTQLSAPTPPHTIAPITTLPTPETTQEPASPVADVIPTFILPVEGMLGASHDPTTQVFSDTMKDWRVHLGIDIMATLGDAVYASADGRVTKIWDDPLYGCSLSIGHTGGAVSIYKNLAPELADGLEVGADVRAGDVIGAVGDGAIIELAEEPHLHFEIKIDDVAVDPLEYLSKNALATLERDVAFEH